MFSRRAAIVGGGSRNDGDDVNPGCASGSLWMRKVNQPTRVELDRIESPGLITDITADVDPSGRVFVAWTRVAADGGVTVRVQIVE